MMGITRDSILKMDTNTKEVLVTFPLRTVKRWAAAPTSFTVDFGDHQDKYPFSFPNLLFSGFVIIIIIIIWHEEIFNGEFLSRHQIQNNNNNNKIIK